MGWIRIAIGALLLAGGGLARAQQAGESHDWSYQGEHAPAHWGDLEPQYRSCKVGQLQSPIDIRGAKPAPLPAIDFAYGSSPLRIVDNGHTVQVTPVPGSYITLGGVRHDLLQVHFHHPAEEQVGGKGFPMVAHLVHKDAEGRREPLHREGLEAPPGEGGSGGRPGGSVRRPGRAPAGLARLLYLRRIPDHASLQRGGDLVRAQDAGDGVACGGGGVREAVSGQRPPPAAAQWPRHPGERVALDGWEIRACIGERPRARLRGPSH
jgi:hypothetical protein